MKTIGLQMGLKKGQSTRILDAVALLEPVDLCFGHRRNLGFVGEKGETGEVTLLTSQVLEGVDELACLVSLPNAPACGVLGRQSIWGYKRRAAYASMCGRFRISSA